MARGSTPGTTLLPERPPRRRIGGRRILTTVLGVVIGAVAVFYAGGGWYYANQIRDGALVLGPPAVTPAAVEVVGVDEGSITLRTDRDGDAARPGVQGVRGDDGYLQVGPVAEASADTVTRPVVGTWGPPPQAGDLVSVDGFAYPDDPAAAFVYPFTEITYDSDIGAMDAWYLRGSGDLWMIFVHGRGAPKAEALRMLPIAFDRGYHALVIGYRNDPGLPEDPSGYTQYGLTEWLDVSSAAAYARANGARRIVVVGYSMGGAAVLRYLQESPLRNQTVAAILDSPVVDLEATVDHNADSTRLPLLGTVPRSLTAVAKQLVSWRFGIDWDAYDVTDRWQDLHTPMLVFHGTNDGSVPIEPTRRLANLRPDLVSLIETDADHVQSWNLDPEGYRATIEAFLDANS